MIILLFRKSLTRFLGILKLWRVQNCLNWNELQFDDNVFFHIDGGYFLFCLVQKRVMKFVLLFGSPLYCDDHIDAFFVTCRCCNLFISMVWVWRAVLAASPVQRLVHTTGGGEGGSCIWRGLSENKWCPYSHTNCSPTIGWRWCGIQFCSFSMNWSPLLMSSPPKAGC